MNKAAFVSFLRHLFILLIILKIVNSLVLMLQSATCKTLYESHNLFPIHTKVHVRIVSFSIDFLFSFFSSIGFLELVLCIIAIFGAASIDKHPTINCSAGLGILFLAPVEAAIATILYYLKITFEKLIKRSVVRMFIRTNDFHNYSIDADDPQSYSEMFSKPYFDGWSTVAFKSGRNEYIDYLQITQKCCGLSGRSFWEIPIPRSCCSDEYPDEQCILQHAYSNTCLHEYDVFKHCMSGLSIEAAIFAILSACTAGVSLYLGYMRKKYPHGEYDDYSSSDEDEVYNGMF